MSSIKIINNISSSSEDYENQYAKVADEKKRKRMISNRESARRSRMKKEQHVMELNDQVSFFRAKSNEILQKINEMGPSLMAIESENSVLRMEGKDLKKRLELLQQLLVSSSSDESTSSSSYLCGDVENNNYYKNNYNNNIDHVFDAMDFLQEPWLQHGFEQSQEYY